MTLKETEGIEIGSVYAFMSYILRYVMDMMVIIALKTAEILSKIALSNVL